MDKATSWPDRWAPLLCHSMALRSVMKVYCIYVVVASDMIEAGPDIIGGTAFKGKSRILDTNC